MATLKLYLDIRRPKANGLYNVTLAVGNNGNTAYIILPVKIEIGQWDKTRQRVINHPSKNLLTSRLNSFYSAYQSALLDFISHNDGTRYTAIQLRDKLNEIVRPSEVDASTFSEFFKKFGENHRARRTRELYSATWRKIERFAEDARELKFEDITREWLDSFFLWLAKDSPSVNARNIHLRNIRSVFNAAIDEELTTLYPFRRYRIKPVETPKRSLSPEQLRYIFNADVPGGKRKYRDLFKLSFLLIGINIGDMLLLAPDSMQNGHIEYNRQKTHRLYSIKLLPEAEELIKLYKGEHHLLSPLDKCQDYRNFAAKLNNVLQSIMPGVTTYYARHSWATIAASLDIPKETIAAALGHGGNTVTDIYIKFDQRKVDAANRRVADFVLYGKKNSHVVKAWE